MASRVEGLDSFNKKMKLFPSVIVAEVRPALAKEANAINALQKHLVAVGPTGDLKESIQWVWGDQDPPAYATVRSSTSIGDPKMTVIITAGNEKVRRAHLIEFGTAPHINAGLFPGTQHPGTDPKPFFYPPFRTRKKPAKSAIARAVTKAIKKVAAS